MTTSGPRLDGRSLLIFDDAVRRIEDHPYEYVRSVARIHLEAGAKVTLICHRDIERPETFAAMGVEVLPIIERTMGAGQYTIRGRRDELAVMARQNIYFTRLLTSHLRYHAHDVALVPDSTLFDAFCWRLLGLTGAARKLGRIAILVRYHFGIIEGAPNVCLKKRLWKIALSVLRPAIKAGKVLILSDSEQLSEDYREVTRVKPVVIHSPRIYADPLRTAGFEGTDSVTFGMLGSARHDKGADLFQAAIKRLIESGRAGGMRFVLQWHRPLMLPKGGVCERDPVLLKSDQVRFIDQPLSSEEYDSAFAEIDCMVLPYRRQLYRASTSGVAVEAACAGVPMIVTAGTWLSHFMEANGAGLTIEEENIEALTEAMSEMAAQIDPFTQRAREASVTARNNHSSADYVDILWCSPLAGVKRSAK